MSRSRPRSLSHALRFTLIACSTLCLGLASAPKCHGAVLFRAAFFAHRTPISNPGRIGAADFDGDGRADIAISAASTDLLRIGFGRGDGTFTPDAASNVVDTTVGDNILFPDLNHDGKADVVLFDGTLRVHLGLGTGLFGSEINEGSPTASFPRDLFAGDVDEDGWIDIAVSHGDSLALWRNHGDGTLEPFTAMGVGMTATAFVDVDGDHKADLAGYVESNTAVAHGNGNGTFGAPIVSGPGVARDFADLDGDGFADAVGVSSFGNGGVSYVSFGDGSGSFTPADTLPFLGTPHILHLGPSGPFTIVSFDYVLNQVVTQEIEPDKSLGPAISTGGPLLSSELGGFADFDGDGRDDLLGCADGYAYYTTFLTAASGRPQAAPEYPTGARPNRVVLADLNGDGKVDAITPNAGAGTISVLLGDGNGHFLPKTDFAAGSTPRALAMGDLTGDGVPDAALADSTQNALVVVPGNGDGTFGAPVAYAAGSGPNDLALGDFNHDGRLDAAVLNLASATVSILLQQPGGTMGPATSLATSTSPRRIAIQDLDGDNNPDLVILEQGSRYRIRVFRGDGAGGFSLVGTYTTNVFADTAVLYGALGLSDVTGDGKLDAVLSARTTGVGILPGNGDGTFGSPITLAGGGIIGSRDVTFFDLDGDAKVDMASVGDLSAMQQTGAVAFFHANGGGTYQPWDGYGAGISPSGIAVADLDMDGLPDMVVSNEGSNSVSVFLHTSTPSVAVQTPPITTHFALSATPNPASGPWSVSFSLPGSGPAHLEVFDLAGRIVAKREVGRFGAGSHVLALPETGSLPTGVYFLRLTRAGTTQVAKVCAIR